MDVGRSNGRRQQVRKRGFRTKKEAQSALNEALADLQHGSYVRPRRVTFGEYLDEWVATAALAGRRPTTIAGYRKEIRLYVKPALGDFEVQQITAVDIDRPYAQLASAGSLDGRGALSKSSIRKVHSARLVVRQAMTTVDPEPSLGDVKSTRSRRLIDLDATTVVVLKAQRTHQLQERLRAGPKWVDSGLVFTMPDGRGWHPDVMTRAFARLVKRSGLPRIRLHDLRHTRPIYSPRARTSA